MSSRSLRTNDFERGAAKGAREVLTLEIFAGKRIGSEPFERASFSTLDGRLSESCDTNASCVGTERCVVAPVQRRGTVRSPGRIDRFPSLLFECSVAAMRAPGRHHHRNDARVQELNQPMLYKREMSL